MSDSALPVDPTAGHSTNGVIYRERLWPSPGTWVIVLGVSLAGILVFAPISIAAGYIGAAALAVLMTVLLVTSTPTIEVTDHTVRVGRAQIERRFVGEVTAHLGEDATAQRGTQLHGLAFVCFRGWVKSVVRIEITDTTDRTPYWLTSTRHPKRLVRALNSR